MNKKASLVDARIMYNGFKHLSWTNIKQWLGMHRSNLMSTVTRLRTIFCLSTENQKIRGRHISYWKSRTLATSVALNTHGVSRADRWAASVYCSDSVQYRITVWNSSWPQICTWENKGTWEISCMKRRFHEIWVSDAFQTDIHYCTRPQEIMNTSYGDVIYAYRLTTFYEENHWSPMNYIRKVQ